MSWNSKGILKNADFQTAEYWSLQKPFSNHHMSFFCRRKYEKHKLIPSFSSFPTTEYKTKLILISPPLSHFFFRGDYFSSGLCPSDQRGIFKTFLDVENQHKKKNFSC